MSARDAFLQTLAPPRPADGESAAYRVYADPIAADVNWSDELEELHEESSRDHFLDVWTRRALLDAIIPAITPTDSVIADLGCSSGYLLEDLHARWPAATLVGIDLVAGGLRRARENVPPAELLLADVTNLPLGGSTVDAVVSANLLEHVPDDAQALREIARILRPGGRAAIVVPAGPHLYDYYDGFLGHERRYARRELAGRAERAGLRVVRDAYIGAFLYPPFWAVKQRNRRRFGTLTADEVTSRVQQDIQRTTDSRLGAMLCAVERTLSRVGVSLPFGIRSFVVVERPREGHAG